MVNFSGFARVESVQKPVSDYLRMVYKQSTPPILVNNYTVEIKDNQRVHKGVHNYLNTMLLSTDLRHSIDIAETCKTYILTSTNVP